MPPVLGPWLHYTKAQVTTAAGKVAVAADDKISKCSNLDQAYLSMPVAIVTFSG